MRKIFKVIFFAIALCAGAAKMALADNTMMIMNAAAAASPTPNATTGAVYLSIMNMGKDADNLLSVSTPAAGMAMLHESKDENGVMKMIMLDKLEIPAGKTVSITPGHMHIMLDGLKGPLKAKDHVQLDLVFEKAGTIKADAVVMPLEDITKIVN